MSKAEDAREFHLQVVAAARRSNDRHKHIPDLEFEDLMQVLEGLGGVAERAAEAETEPSLVGRAMLFYAKCIANGTSGGAKGMVPETADAG